MHRASDILSYLRELGDPQIAAHSQRFFKTGPGEYGEGDVFLGIRVPVIRKAVAHFKDTDAGVVEQLLHSELHEVRLFALLAWVRLYQRGSEAEREHIYKRYLANTQRVNGWDLVDSSAMHIVGAWLFERDKHPLTVLAHSPILWGRRIGIIATFYDIRQNRFEQTLRIAEILVNDEHDLIHKAVGWMLREVGKRDQAAEEGFLRRHYKTMPRTMLRYAIERFPSAERKAYLAGTRW